MLKYWVIAWLVDGRLAVWGGKEWIRTDYSGPADKALVSVSWKPSSAPYGYISKRNARNCANRLMQRQNGIAKAIAVIPANHKKLEPLDMTDVHARICREVVVPHGGEGDL